MYLNFISGRYPNFDWLVYFTLWFLPVKVV
jgi:hypothetical protein